jgi:hypothetical protein
MTERQLSPAASELRAALIQEWEHPTERPNQPIVLLDRRAPGDARHVFVVWDRWGAMEQLERSETIMDACEKVLGVEESLKVTVAMGLTKEEAKRLNIRYK